MQSIAPSILDAGKGDEWPHKAFIDYLRFELHDYIGADVVTAARKVTAASKSHAESEVTRHRDRGVREYENEVAADSGFPESFELRGQLVEGVDVVSDVTLLTDIDASGPEIRFKLRPVPEHLPKARRKLLEVISERLTDGNEVPVYQGELRERH